MLGHDDQRMGPTLAITCVAVEPALDLKAQMIEDRATGALRLDHLDDQLVDLEIARGVDHRLHERGAKSIAPPACAHDQIDVGDVALPAG